MRFYERARTNDLYLSFAVTPPSGIRDREIYTGVVRDDPTLQVVSEDNSGVVVSGMKMLATGAIFGDEVYIGNLTAIDDKRQSESITAAIPNNAPGVSFWAREPYERHARQEADYPLSYRFDENDAVLVCDRVKIPWERVFLHNNGAWSRRIYIETPANVYQNQQSNIRFWAKMGLIVGLASRMCQANGVDKVPAVRETLGRLVALEATIGGLVNGQIEACENWPEGLRRRTGAWSMPRSIGARSTTPKSSTRCGRLRVPRRCRCRPQSISSPTRNSRIASSAGGARRAWKPARATSSTSWSGT